MLTHSKTIKEEAKLLAIRTSKELMTKFHKSMTEAEQIVSDALLEQYVVRHPMALHDSAYDWAVKLLTEKDDIETLERYLA